MTDEKIGRIQVLSFGGRLKETRGLALRMKFNWR